MVSKKKLRKKIKRLEDKLDDATAMRRYWAHCYWDIREKHRALINHKSQAETAITALSEAIRMDNQEDTDGA